MRAPAATRPDTRRGSATAVMLGLICFIAATACVPARAEAPERPGWTRVFVDDFNGAAGQSPSAQRWTFDIGTGYAGGGEHWGTGEVESYTSSPRNAHVDGKGHLRIVALRDAAGHWTSARLQTRRADFRAPPHGVMRIEARMRFPALIGDRAAGYWPAFWAMPATFRQSMDWPAVGEIDIAENVNGLDRVWGTLHCGIVPGGPCHEKTGRSVDRACPNRTCQGGFHVYAFEWDRSVKPEQLRWYVDGELYHTIRRTDLPAATWDRMTLGKGVYVLLNLAMGGEFPDRLNAPVSTPTPDTEPGHALVVDYVGVWTHDGAPSPRR